MPRRLREVRIGSVRFSSTPIRLTNPRAWRSIFFPATVLADALLAGAPLLLVLLLHPAGTANPSRPAAVIAVANLRFIWCVTSFRSMTPRRRATGAGCVA